MEQITLCMPDGTKTCFACCPPIRPRHYEHISHKNIIRRILRENTRNYDPLDDRIVPIIGYSCWALGYLDRQYRKIGCLLHPGVNNGKDLRYRVNYGKKCSREHCPQSLIFQALSRKTKLFLLGIAKGMDSFEYSSTTHNPLFTLLLWGPSLLERAAKASNYQPLSREAFFNQYPVLARTTEPRSLAYMLEYLTDKLGSGILLSREFAMRFQYFVTETLQQIGPIPTNNNASCFTHQLKVKDSFCNMLRLGLKVKKIDPGAALSLKEIIDQRLEAFVSRCI